MAGLCCLCRRHLGWTTAPCPPASWASAASALPARDPRRPLLRPAGLPAAPPALPAGPRRGYGTEEQPQPRQKTKMLILGFSNPVNWVRTRLLAFLIWAYFDKEFSIKEFSEGAKQVCSLSRGDPGTSRCCAETCPHGPRSPAGAALRAAPGAAETPARSPPPPPPLPAGSGSGVDAEPVSATRRSHRSLF